MNTEMDIHSFAGSDGVKEKRVQYEGKPEGVREVVERTIDVIQRYSRRMGAGDLAGAYALTDSGLQAAMPFKKFTRQHENAAQTYSGPVLDFQINLFAYVYSDDAARKKSKTSVEGWFKGTVQEARRGRVIGFWFCDRVARTGCEGALWIAEENNEYRIANFDFWRP